MQYEIHSKKVFYNGLPCGIYKSYEVFTEYRIMRADNLVKAINGMSKEEAIEAVTKLRDDAAKQVQWKEEPQNKISPILIGPAPAPIDHVRKNIDNTKRFADDILKALQGK